VRDWHVSDEPSLLDHWYVLFQVGNVQMDKLTFRYLKRIDWKLYTDDLIVNLDAAPCHIHLVQDADLTMIHPLVLSPKLSS
jgi:hypothetical protein